MLKNPVFPSIFQHQMSLPDVVSGLLLRVSCGFDSRRGCHLKSAVKPYVIRVSGVFSFLLRDEENEKIEDFHQQILRQLMEIRTNVVRLSGGRLANKNQQKNRRFANENALSANGRKNRAKFLLMEKAVVSLLIRSFRCGQATIAHYLYALSYYIIAVTGGGCFGRA